MGLSRQGRGDIHIDNSDISSRFLGRLFQQRKEGLDENKGTDMAEGNYQLIRPDHLVMDPTWSS
jgi:hypothetical protein